MRALAVGGALAGVALALVAVTAAWPWRAAALCVLGTLFAISGVRAHRADEALPDMAGRSVKDAMVSRVVTIAAALSLIEVEQMLLSHPYRAFPVVRGDRVVGILRRPDVLRQPATERARLSAQAVMIRLHPSMIAAPTDALPAALDRLRNQAGCVIVVENGQLRGLLTASARGDT